MFEKIKELFVSLDSTTPRSGSLLRGVLVMDQGRVGRKTDLRASWLTSLSCSQGMWGDVREKTLESWGN